MCSHHHNKTAAVELVFVFRMHRMCTVADLEEKDYFAHLKEGKWEIQKLRFLQ